MLVRNGALVFSVNNPQAVLSVMPTAKLLAYKGREFIAVKHTLDATKVLRNLGLRAPSPLHSYYWPGRYTPMTHQVETAEFMCLNTRGFVLNSQGTGKTSAACWAADYLISRGFVRRVLVVCPLSVIGVWAEELFTTLPHRTAGQMVGTKRKRLAVLAEDNDFSIINFDGLTSLFHEERKHGRIERRWSELDDKFDMLIVDEASTYRNAQTLRYKALKHMVKPDTRIHLMSGTMTPNAPTDAWALCKLITPSSVPNSFKLFQETTMRQVGPYKWVPKQDAKDIVFKAMQPAVRFAKADCLDLPPLVFSKRQVEMTPEQVKLFDKMRISMRHEDKDSGVEISAANAAVKMLKLQQICCGVVKDDMGDPVLLDAKPRLAVLDEIVSECDEKVIVFVPFIYAMDMVREHLSKSFTCEVINGSVPSGQRNKIFSAFQHTDNPKVLIAHPAVAAHGLNLTAASTIVWYAPIHSIEQFEQANARIERKGQTNHMTIYQLGAHPFEWAIYQALRSKASVQSALMGLYQQLVGA